MRILKPTIFNEKILPLLFGINLYRDLGADRMTIATVRNLKHVGINDDLLAKIHEQLLLSEDFINDVSTPIPKPYTTMVHRDFWVNNLMISISKYGGERLQYNIILYIKLIIKLIFLLQKMNII